MPLLDKYDIYQHVMDYWVTTMQDDAYVVTADGWKAVTARILEKDKKGKSKDKGWSCDLIPKEFMVARFFAKDRARIEELSSQVDSTGSEISELEEEHGGEDGAFSELDKINAANINARLKQIKGDKSARDEAAVLNAWTKLKAQEGELKKQLKTAEQSLDQKAYARYTTLKEADIKSIVVDDKWMGALDTAIHSEMDRISQALTQRVKDLAERYESPLPDLTDKVAEMEAKVQSHLERMGFSWK
jgi:type I restriction enzyme M protein